MELSTEEELQVLIDSIALGKKYLFYAAIIAFLSSFFLLKNLDGYMVLFFFPLALIYTILTFIGYHKIDEAISINQLVILGSLFTLILFGLTPFLHASVLASAYVVFSVKQKRLIAEAAHYAKQSKPRQPISPIKPATIRKTSTEAYQKVTSVKEAGSNIDNAVIKNVIAYLRYFVPVGKWIDPDLEMVSVDLGGASQESPACSAAHVGFIVLYVNDTGNSLNSVTLSMVNKLEVTPRELYKAGLKNLNTHVYEKVKTGIQISQSKDGHYYRMALDGDFDASLLLLDRVWNNLQLRKLTPNGTVVAIPNRGSLLFCDAGQSDSIQIMQSKAKQLATGSDWAITERLFIRRHHRWTEYLLGEILNPVQQLQKKFGEFVLPTLFLVQQPNQWNSLLHGRGVELNFTEKNQSLSKEVAPTTIVTKCLHGGLFVAFVKYNQEGELLQPMTDFDFSASGLTLDELAEVAFENLYDLSGAGRDGINLKIEPSGAMFEVHLAHENYPNGCILLLNQLWDEKVKAVFANPPIAVIPSSNHLAFCDSMSPQGILELQKYANNNHPSVVDQNAGFSPQLYIREEGLWKPYITAEYNNVDGKLH